jgi:hypothetical protein
MGSNLRSDPLPTEEILSRSVFYPASGTDGRPVKYLAGFSHSFVYADCNVSRDVLERDLNTFKGYGIWHLRSVPQEELCSRPFTPVLPQPGDGDPSRQHVQPGFLPYALWAVYERQAGFDEAHGPQRFSLLFVGGEGAATFKCLYYSNRSAPSVIALIRCDAFTGNWTAFLDPTKILARSDAESIRNAGVLLRRLSRPAVTMALVSRA